MLMETRKSNKSNSIGEQITVEMSFNSLDRFYSNWKE